jgi:6-phosphogluconolactonase
LKNEAPRRPASFYPDGCVQEGTFLAGAGFRLSWVGRMPAHMAQQNRTRRQFLQQSFAAAAFSGVLRSAFSQERKVFAYVGTYTGNGEGIYLFQMNPQDGKLTLLKLAAKASNPSWIALSPSRRFLYAVNEDAPGSVSAFSVNQANGDLTLINQASSGGSGPAHLSVDSTGKYVFVANYGDGSIEVLPVTANGGLGSPTYSRQDKGSLGAKKATTAPPGSFAIDGHTSTHAHMIQADPGNRFVLQTELGQDRIYVFRLDQATGKLTPLTEFASLPSGDGPRHFTFHPNGRWLYSVQEESSTVAFFHFDPQTGAIRPEQTLSTLPPGFKGTNYISEILLTPDSRFLYIGNRLKNTVAIFSLGAEGRLTYVGETSTEGDYPRSIAIDPSGSFLYACNHRSDDITCFRINRQTGMLTFTGEYTAVGSPSCILFLS